MDTKLLRARAIAAPDLGVFVSSEDLLELLDRADAVATQPMVPLPDVDVLAQAIREVDGSHRLGAGELAEKLVEWLAAQSGPAADTAQVTWPELRRSLALYALGLARPEVELAVIEQGLDVLAADDGPLSAIRRSSVSGMQTATSCTRTSL